jgi:hypothetical protein
LGRDRAGRRSAASIYGGNNPFWAPEGDAMGGKYDTYWDKHLGQLILAIQAEEESTQIDLPYEDVFKGRRDSSFNMSVTFNRQVKKESGARHLDVLAYKLMKYCEEGYAYRASARINPGRRTFRLTVRRLPDSGSLAGSGSSKRRASPKGQGGDETFKSGLASESIGKTGLFQKLDILRPKMIELDRRRFLHGEEWKRGDLPELQTIVFDNDRRLNADTRFLIFWLCCVINRGVRYERLWDEGLHKIMQYLLSNGPLPQVRMDESKHILATMDTIDGCDKSLNKWSVNTIDALVRFRGNGNLYRLAGRIATCLLGLNHSSVVHLDNGSPGLIGTWKRLWMFLMFPAARIESQPYGKLV